MENTFTIKTAFAGDLRMLEIKGAAFDALLAGVRQAYDVSSDLILTYKDTDGDEVRFDTDEELALAIRTCPSPLRVTVQPKPKPKGQAGLPKAPAEDAMDEDCVLLDPGEAVEQGGRDAAPGGPGGGADSPADEDDPVAAVAEAEASEDPEASMLFKTAAKRLGRVHGVNITPTHLARALTLLQLRPRVLVRRGLTPKRLLRTGAGAGAGGAAAVSSSVEDDDMKDGAGAEASTAANVDGVGVAWGCPGRCPPGPHMREPRPAGGPVHRVLVQNGVEVAPEQVPTLLRALGVGPGRFVKLGLLDRDTVRACHGFRGDRHCGGGGGGGGWGMAYMYGPPPPPPMHGFGPNSMHPMHHGGPGHHNMHGGPGHHHNMGGRRSGGGRGCQIPQNRAMWTPYY